MTYCHRCIAWGLKSRAKHHLSSTGEPPPHLIADARSTGKVGLLGFCMGAGFCQHLSPRSLFNTTASNTTTAVVVAGQVIPGHDAVDTPSLNPRCDAHCPGRVTRNLTAMLYN
jgi:hypothetical protein